MPLTREELQRIAARTLAHYDRGAHAFWEDTRDHDVSQNIDALLRHIGSPRHRSRRVARAGRDGAATQRL